MHQRRFVQSFLDHRQTPRLDQRLFVRRIAHKTAFWRPEVCDPCIDESIIRVVDRVTRQILGERFVIDALLVGLRTRKGEGVVSRVVLRKDIEERHDLTQEHPEIAKTLQQKWDEWNASLLAGQAKTFFAPTQPENVPFPTR